MIKVCESIMLINLKIPLYIYQIIGFSRNFSNSRSLCNSKNQYKRNTRSKKNFRHRFSKYSSSCSKSSGSKSSTKRSRRHKQNTCMLKNKHWSSVPSYLRGTVSSRNKGKRLYKHAEVKKEPSKANKLNTYSKIFFDRDYAIMNSDGSTDNIRYKPLTESELRDSNIKLVNSRPQVSNYAKHEYIRDTSDDSDRSYNKVKTKEVLNVITVNDSNLVNHDCTHTNALATFADGNSSINNLSKSNDDLVDVFNSKVSL